MTQLLEHHSLAAWLVDRMTHADPQPPGVVRLVGLHVLDPTFTTETAARTSWIGDGSSVRDAMARWGDELDRYDAVAAVNWPSISPEIVAMFVNP
ncbi:MAG: hypothetical protein HZB15_06945 [Actinobacteria bacterium]|nr:hypothetical protein [Actinomycetota bacterium]